MLVFPKISAGHGNELMSNARVNNNISEEMNSFLKRLFPICRSITGNGNRETLRILQEIVPFEIKEYPSGAEVYDWVIPKEWNIRDAWIKDGGGNRIIDFKQSNIHVVSYSLPINQKMSFEDLKLHLHYSEDLPEAIPYRTTYYNQNWGFCVTKAQFDALANIDGELEVCIDSSLNESGSLTIGELVIPGKISKEILISTYFCHPSLANDNLSGTIMTAFLARELMMNENLNYSFRIIFVPETIGAITYCAMNEFIMKNIDQALVVTGVAGPGKYGYKQCFEIDHPLNYFIEEVFKENTIDFVTYPFDVHGSDERQYSSQGFRINTASLTKDKYYEYDYYHSSLDNLDFVDSKFMAKTLNLHIQLLKKLDKNILFKNKIDHCEVMLSRHDIYPKTGGNLLPDEKMDALDIRLWLLFLCDGKTFLHEVSKKLKVSIEIIYQEAKVLSDMGVLERVDIK